MSKRRSTEQKRCLRCRIHQTLCFCEFLKPIENKNRVSIIMHHREEHLTSNTATLAQKILTNSDLFLRGLPEAPFQFESLKCQADTQILYLYPHDEAVDLNSINFSLDKKFHLIVPDGSWTQARKVYKRENLSDKVICVKLPTGLISEYHLRKTHIESGLSTYEAIAHALGIIESTDIKNNMMEIFRVMVERVIKSRTSFHNS